MEEQTDMTLFDDAVNMAQNLVAMQQIAKVLGALRKALLEEGFEQSEVQSLCETWITAIMMRKADQ